MINKDKWLTGNYVCYVKEESKGIWREWLATYLPPTLDYVLIKNEHKEIAEAVINNPATKTEFKSNGEWHEDDFFGNYHNNGDMFQWRLKQKLPLTEPFRVTEHPTSKAYREMVEKEEGVRPKVSHYQKGKIEPIDFINSHELNFNLGNAIKYITRCNFKGTKREDIQKAIDYLNFELEFAKDSQ